MASLKNYDFGIYAVQETIGDDLPRRCPEKYSGWRAIIMFRQSHLRIKDPGFYKIYVVGFRFPLTSNPCSGFRKFWSRITLPPSPHCGSTRMTPSDHPAAACPRPPQPRVPALGSPATGPMVGVSAPPGFASRPALCWWGVEWRVNGGVISPPPQRFSSIFFSGHPSCQLGTSPQVCLRMEIIVFIVVPIPARRVLLIFTHSFWPKFQCIFYSSKIFTPQATSHI